MTRILANEGEWTKLIVWYARSNNSKPREGRRTAATGGAKSAWADAAQPVDSKRTNTKPRMGRRIPPPHPGRHLFVAGFHGLHSAARRFTRGYTPTPLRG